MDSILDRLNPRSALNLERKTFHILIGLLIYAPYFFLAESFPYTYWFGFLLILAIGGEISRIKIPFVNNLLLTNFGSLFRKSEMTHFSAIIPFILCMTICTAFLPRPLCHVAVACQLLADPFASLIGIKFGKRELLDSRTLEGSLGCMGLSFLINFFILNYFYHPSLLPLLIVSLLTSVVTAAAELVPIPYVDDNFRVGFFTGTFLFIMVEIVNVF